MFSSYDDSQNFDPHSTLEHYPLGLLICSRPHSALDLEHYPSTDLFQVPTQPLNIIQYIYSPILDPHSSLEQIYSPVPTQPLTIIQMVYSPILDPHSDFDHYPSTYLFQIRSCFIKTVHDCITKSSRVVFLFFIYKNKNSINSK